MSRYFAYFALLNKVRISLYFAYFAQLIVEKINLYFAYFAFLKFKKISLYFAYSVYLIVEKKSLYFAYFALLKTSKNNSLLCLLCFAKNKNICSFWLETLCQVQKNSEANFCFLRKNSFSKGNKCSSQSFFVPGIMFFSLKDTFSWVFIL